MKRIEQLFTQFLPTDPAPKDGLSRMHQLIARELRRANDLKVLELSERINPFNGQPSPIIPITEEPSKSDTEVTFGVGDENKMTLRERMVAEFDRAALDDE